MRSDMHKVVVERPRWNPGPAKNGRRANLPDELLPKHEGMRRPHRMRKGFTDLLGPLRRWLHAQIGRPWDDVYSEACAVIKPDSVIRAHIKTHLLEFVERHTFMHNGEVCVIDPWRGSGIKPVQARRFGRSRFYVHPESRLLCEIKPIPRRDRRKTYEQLAPNPLRWLSERMALKQIDGIWYTCEFVTVPPHVPFKAYDQLLRRVVGRGELTIRRGLSLHCIRTQQLSTRALRHYGLKNVWSQPRRSLCDDTSVAKTAL